MLAGKTVLVTGGAGSIGSELVRQLLQHQVRSVRVFDNNEYGMFLLKRSLQDERLRFLLGDIRDRDRCRLMVREADVIIHCAALKNLELTEFNIPDLIETNIIGALNLARACIYEGPDAIVNVSTDKAVNPTTSYGTSKLQAEFVFKWLNEVARPLRSYSVRLGNVRDSRGNVFDVWERQRAAGEQITITDPEMRRYYMSCSDAARFIIYTLAAANGGETFIPKMAEYRMVDLAREYGDIRITGSRRGEKVSEQLMTEEERKIAVETEWGYVFK